MDVSFVENYISSLHYYRKPYTEEQVQKMLDNGTAIRADKGGLILGPSHDGGGVYFLVKRDETYYLEGEVEGFEYVLNMGAKEYFPKCFEHLNKPELHEQFPFIPYEIPPNFTTLDVRSAAQRKFLVFEYGGFAIINKDSTKGFIATLEDMNSSVGFEIIDNRLLKYIKRKIGKIPLYFYNDYLGHYEVTI